MEVSTEAVRQNFQSRTDTELLDVAGSGQQLTPESRLVLLQELETRLERARHCPETVQMIHGWYTVIAPTTGIRFPEFCPRCQRTGADCQLRFESPEERKFRLFYWKTNRAVSVVPHCAMCAAELKRARAICSWTGGIAIVLWIAVVIWLDLPRLVNYAGVFLIFTPVVYFYDRTSAVRLGNFSRDFVEYRFRSHQYASTFAALNNVQNQNAETLQSELEAALVSLRN